MFDKVLIANRGEIACRVIRTCRRMGIKTVAVHSDADVNALHVKNADESYNIGPAPAPESYLNAEKIIEVAKACRADAIHPGYGFLSEKPEFADAVRDAGIAFIGPPSSAMRALGTKTEARKVVEPYEVPCIPWANIPIDNTQEAQRIAARFGYPVVVKPSAGGGGIGTSVAYGPEDIGPSIERAAWLSNRFFNRPTLHIEKFVELAKHVETQVLVDRHGVPFVFPERECSLQRRYQKVIEESPSLAVSPLLRARMAEAATRVMRAGGYRNIGTVEMLLDSRNNYYFLEVNSRVQVEHPVTEMVTGLDMIELQLVAAAGYRLEMPSGKMTPKGHAVQARVYAEDPETLLPTGGVIGEYSEPLGEGVRVDSGVTEGYEVSSYYDPLMAKVIAWGPNRETATQRLSRALANYKIEGVVTNLPLLRKLLDSGTWEVGEFHTRTIESEFVPQPEMPTTEPAMQDWWRYGR